MTEEVEENTNSSYDTVDIDRALKIMNQYAVLLQSSGLLFKELELKNNLSEDQKTTVQCWFETYKILQSQVDLFNTKATVH